MSSRSRPADSGKPGKFSIAINDIVYENSTNGVSCYAGETLATFFPRRVICVSGYVLSVRAISFTKGSESRRLLESVFIPSSVELLPKGCVADCPAVSCVAFEIGCRISCIEARGFQCCSFLSSICIPSSVEVLGKSSFADIEHLLTVTFEGGSIVSCLEKSVFSGCSSLSSICIPSSVEAIFEECFLECENLSLVIFEIGSQLLHIGDSAFQDCSSLRAICIPSSVEVIHDSCFQACENLSSVIFESGSQLLRIESYAFWGCLPLSSICIPVRVFEIGCAAFGYTSVSEIFIADDHLNFKLSGTFLLDDTGTSIVVHIGSAPAVLIERGIGSAPWLFCWKSLFFECVI
jgi:hypothetical protein